MADKKPTEKVVPPAEGTEHGYYGTVQDDDPNETYTVAGQTSTGQTANVNDEPKSRQGSKRSE
ncbi:hypothetical protein [Allonocardiopsis opalescens]|uniref:Uncharacterized protein n=1 Tax=Allonocardiopsis opalescens TaxID=1144618 RepID=A0A2T0PVK7_9ACTN|nr:hypothetical protein [Allonocardiopsis opalescens]PRX95576.1 hypothetical protein CLV72_109185 [Allonocardiopsis opalescens]